MTNGQIQQLQDLRRCCNMPFKDKAFVRGWSDPFLTSPKQKMYKESKVILRRLTHQYRNQIRAMERNR